MKEGFLSLVDKQEEVVCKCEVYEYGELEKFLDERIRIYEVIEVWESKFLIVWGGMGRDKVVKLGRVSYFLLQGFEI